MTRPLKVGVHTGLAGSDDVRARSTLRELAPEVVDAEIAREIARLGERADASVPPVEEVVPEIVEEADRKLREERRADTLRRMRSSSVLVQRDGDKLVFKDDRQVRDVPWGSSPHNTN